MPGKKTEQILIRVSPELKEKLQEGADEQGYGTLSGAIRGAAKDVLVDDENGAGSGGNDVLKREINDLRDDLRRDLDDIQETLESVELAVRDDPELERIKADLYREIPRATSVTIQRVRDGEAEWSDVRVDADFDEDSIAQQLDEPRSRIVEALSELRRERDVQTAETDGQRYYWVEK